MRDIRPLKDIVKYSKQHKIPFHEMVTELCYTRALFRHLGLKYHSQADIDWLIATVMQLYESEDI